MDDRVSLEMPNPWWETMDVSEDTEFVGLPEESSEKIQVNKPPHPLIPQWWMDQIALRA